MKKLILLLFIPLISFTQNEDIRLIGTVGTEGNQIKNVGDPTDAQDVVTLSYLEAIIADLQSQIDDLTTSVTDQDGNTYDYLTFCDQVWTVENAEVVTYRDGTPIPQVTDDAEWANLTTGAWAYYDYNPAKGKVYNWYAVAGIHDNDPNTPNKELAPEGWHVASDTEWDTLVNCLINSGYNYDGTIEGNKVAKAMASKTGWNSSANEGSPGNNQSTNNSSGFNALPTGDNTPNGNLFNEGNAAIFWSSSSIDADFSYSYYLEKGNSYLLQNNTQKIYGESIRFVKD